MLTRHFVNSCVKLGAYSAMTRSLHVKTEPLSRDAKEIEIKMPWGKIAGKLWGTGNKQPVLAIHGWQDNAGSFDILAPLLLKNGPVLAIDLPGHGLSSWLPPGAMYSELAYVTLIHRIKKHFGWRKVKILAHSMSGAITFYYASLFPEDVEFAVVLDILKFTSIDVVKHSKRVARAINQFYEAEMQSTESPAYTEEQVIERWIKATDESLDEAACKTLMVRGTLQRKDKLFAFTRDPRLKALPLASGFTHNHLQELSKLICCPYMMVKAKSSSYYEDKKYFYDIVEIMKQNNENFHHVTIPGTHHFHMTNAKAVALVVNPFLEKYNH